MKLQKRVCGLASTRGDLTWGGPIGDAEQQADHHISPQQSTELFGEFGGTGHRSFISGFSAFPWLQ